MNENLSAKELLLVRKFSETMMHNFVQTFDSSAAFELIVKLKVTQQALNNETQKS